MTISKFVISAGLCSALVLGACTDPGTLSVQSDPNQNAKQGALLGGLIGAGVGAIANDSDPLLGALAGGAIGAAGGGVIVNTSSQLAFDGATDRGAYAAAKAGLAQFTKTAASEWAKHGLRVVAIAPGRTLTPINAELLADPDVRAKSLAGIPAGRFGDADEIARLACFLASPAADYVVGETLVADGGFVLTAGRPAP